MRHFYDGKLIYTFTILSATAAAIYDNAIYAIKNVSDNNVSQYFNVVLLFSAGIFVFQMLFTYKSFFSMKFKYKDFPVDWIKNRMIVHINEWKFGEDYEKVCVHRIEKCLLNTMNNVHLSIIKQILRNGDHIMF